MAEHLAITPTGVGILFEDGLPDPVTGKGKKRRYLIGRLGELRSLDEQVTEDYLREKGEELPSVTTVLGILDKPGLPWVAERLTVEGCVRLAAEGGLPQDPERALGRLGQEGLRFRQVWDAKAERGTLRHEDWVHLFAGRELPELDELPESHRKMAMGFAAFLSDFRPTIHEAEQMVASLEHGFSGRPDAVVTLGIDRLPDGTPAPRGRGLVDLKNHERLPRTKPSKTFPKGQVKTPYPENFHQLGLYEIGRVECGYEPTAWRAVVSVDASGDYDFTCSWMEPEEALAFLPAHSAHKRAASRVKRPADQRPAGFEGLAEAA